MTRILGLIAVCGLWLGFAADARAQDSMGAFGGYPTAAITGSPIGTYTPQTYYGPNIPLHQPFGYTTSMAAPGPRYYSSGYSGGYVTYPYSTTTYAYPVYRYRRGLFGPRIRAW